MGGFVFLLLLFLLLLFTVYSCVSVVPQAKAYVVERLGTYQATWDTRTVLECLHCIE